MTRVIPGGAFSSFLQLGTDDLVGYYGYRLLQVGTDEVVIPRTTVGVEGVGDGIYRYTGTAPVTLGVYYSIWDANETEDFQDDQLIEVVSASSVVDSGGAFATRNDIQTRLGRALTDAEVGQVDLLLVLATGALAEACDKTLDWAATYTPVPAMLRILCLELVVRVVQNPQGLKSGSESLGAYSRSGTYTDGGGAFALTETEERLARRAVYGSNSASSRPQSTSDEVYDYLYS